MSDDLEIVEEHVGLGASLDSSYSPGMRVVHLEDFEEPCTMAGDERLAYRRRFVTLFVDEDSTRRGGLGRVARATNAMGEVFALKTLVAPVRAEGEGQDAFDARIKRAGDAFRKEYEVQRLLSGFKGFPRLYGFAQADGIPAIVMEWVDGMTLAQVRRELAVDERGRMAPLDAARLGRDLFDLLTRLDLVGEGFVHRDISPSNIMLRTRRLSAAEQAREGGFDLCLIDFGSSVPLDPEQDPLFTSTYASARRATIGYAPPEMLSDDLPRVAQLRKSAAVDVYAAASVLFELVGGCLPFDVSEGGEESPYRVKADEQPAPLVSAHAPAADMAVVLPHEPEAAFAVAHVMQELGSDLDQAETCRALALVDEQLADLVRACLTPEQSKRPTAQAMFESLSAFCANYIENVGRAVRGERLLPCTAGASWNDSISPYAVNRVVNSVGRAVAFALLVGMTVTTSVLLDGLRASWSLGSLHWEGVLSAPGIAVFLLTPAILGFGARALARKNGRGGVLPGSIALGAGAAVLLALLGGLSIAGMPTNGALAYALIATASAGWVPLVLDYAMMVIPALITELRRVSRAPGPSPARELNALELGGAGGRSDVYIEPPGHDYNDQRGCDPDELPDRDSDESAGRDSDEPPGCDLSDPPGHGPGQDEDVADGEEASDVVDAF